MSTSSYVPPEVWKNDKQPGGKFGAINRPESGARFEQALPACSHPFQLYSLGTPNGVKVSVMLEELLQLGIEGARYDAHLVNIMKGEQFGSGFVEVNPNSKIPALVDQSGPEPINIFESGAMLLYLAEKFNRFIPSDPAGRASCLSWLFWQMGSAPILGGGFGHFFAYAPEKMEYPINRFAMEAKRQLDVLDKQLAKHTYIAGEEYTIADIAIWPWYGVLAQGGIYEGSARFLDTASYKHLNRWAELVAQREAVKKGRTVLKM